MEHPQGDCPVEAGGCGAGISGAPVGAEHRRRVIDLPVVTSEVTERWAQTGCAGCGTAATAAFPDTMRAPVAYGGGSALHHGREPGT